MSVRYSINPAIENLEPSATLAINQSCQRLRDQGDKIYRLGFGQSPFPVPSVVTEALRQHAPEKAYLPTLGLPELRSSVCDYYQRTEQLDYTPEQVMIGPGTKELMYLLQSVVESALVLPSPSWVSYAPQAEILGRDVFWLPGDLTTDSNLVPAALEAHCEANPNQAKLLVLNYPCNPTGGSYSAAQLEQIAAVARRYRVLVLSDEIYSGLDFKGEHVSIARFYKEGTIISNGLSKWCGAGGWRLGAFVFPEQLSDVKDAMAALATETFSAVSSPIQYAAVTAFSDNPEIGQYLIKARQILERVLGYSYRQLLQAGATLGEPRGGFYLFPNVDSLRDRLKIEDSVSFCSRLLEGTGVAVLPGSAFGRPASELSVRIACVDFDGTRALDAASGRAEIDEDFIREYCRPTVEGIDRLCEWLQNG